MSVATIRVDHLEQRNIYLHDVALSDALAAWHSALLAAGCFGPLAAEEIPLAAALGRVTAAPVWALISSPHYHAAAMDGFAVRAAATRGATETRPLRLAVGSEAIPVDTGDPLPPAADAVIKIEDVQLLENEGGQQIEILAATPPWRYVRPMGEDVVATELVLPANQRLRPQDLGVLAGSGHTTVGVYRRPRVAILPTGSELVAPGSELKPGDIIEYNSLMLGAMAEEAGCLVTRLPIHRDEREVIRVAVADALAGHDLVVVNAGSSAGSEDFTAGIVAELGTLCVHGIAIRPGHPVILGTALGKALVGIPGYPVSAAVTFDLIVRPLLYRWQGQLPPERPVVEAVLTRKALSPLGEDEFMRVALGKVGDRIMATPLASGAGVLTSLVKADGIVTIPRFHEGYHPGETVQVELWRPRRVIDRTVVAIGSHDMTLDLLADYLQRADGTLRLSSAHVGSVGEAHLAGSHLLDEATGDYNVGSVGRMLAEQGVPSVMLGFVNRTQGLMTLPGNPKGIRTLADLLRPDVRFVNRQRGAGTRVLLDYELKRQGLDARQISGYERQEYTHLAVAAAVKSGAADCGLGILAAARALGLDFTPLFDERYDLIMPVQHFESPLLEPLLRVIRDRTLGFAAAVEALGGYGTAQMGELLAEIR
jgi:putative molybdopterin biosynthesis protein